MIGRLGIKIAREWNMINLLSELTFTDLPNSALG